MVEEKNTGYSLLKFIHHHQERHCSHHQLYQVLTAAASIFNISILEKIIKMATNLYDPVIGEELNYKGVMLPPPFKDAKINTVDNLVEQDINIDPKKLHPLTPQVISRQATINIGTIGHVAHGKSTVVRAISGVKTIRFKNEMVRNITIKLGYANAKIYLCRDPRCPRPECYTSQGSSHIDHFPCEVEGFTGEYELVRHVSFVDCPGHDILMATMLNGAAVMDAALLLIAGNEPCPQPQTSEHLAAVEIMKLKHIIILQNKIDLVKESDALNQYDEIKRFVKGTVADSSPIIAISAQLKYNIDVVCEYIVKRIPIPIRDFTSSPRLIVIRSFDVNKPGESVENLKGGVAGGSILQGVLKIGDEIEVRPGIVTKEKDGTIKCKPIKSKIVSLLAVCVCGWMEIVYYFSR